MNIFKEKQWRVFFMVLIVIFVVGLIGIMFLPGNGKWGFIFENMLWFPIDIVIAVFIFDKIISENNEKVEEKREFDNYYTLAERRLNDLIKLLKIQMISAYTGEIIIEENKLNNAFENLFINIENKITEKYINDGHDVPIFNPNDLFNPEYKNISYLKLSSDAASILIPSIHNHFDMFMKYMPKELFSSIDSILLDLEENVLFSQNENLIQAREIIINNKNSSKEIAYQFQCFYKDYYLKVTKLEKLIFVKTKRV
ncbi:hypothetical protein [Carnobacterium maltaromaticum]|uniref:hypothetical protein n=1 Tax=Carnobacterium maltaromaticum TaxID=2751 RepID=UPI0039AECD5A